MQSGLVPYFHAQSLRARLLADIDDALRSARISSEEREWLYTLADTNAQAQSVLPRPRVDQLLVEDGLVPEAELAAAILISHIESNVTTVYLNTPLYGLQRFDSRAQLLATLEVYFPAHGSIARQFEYRRIEGDVHEARMLAIVDQRAQRIADFNAVLQGLPTLQDALNTSLEEQLKSALADISIDLSSSRVQLMSKREGGADTVVSVQTWQQAVYAEYIQAEAVTRCFLDQAGRALSPAQSARCEQALKAAVVNLQYCFERGLRSYWIADPVDKRSSELTVLLSEIFQSELLRRRHDGTLSDEDFRRVRVLVRPAGAPLDGLPTRVKRLSLVLDNQEQLKLSGMYLIDLVDPGYPGFFLYTPDRGLRRSNDLAALNAHFLLSETKAELFPWLSLNDQEQLRAKSVVDVRIDDVEGPLFADRTQSLIALQYRNVRYALTLPSERCAQGAVMVDDALDIRALIRGGLLSFGHGRWEAGSATFYDTWLSPSASESEIAPAEVFGTFDPFPVSGVSPSWLDRIHTLDNQCALVRSVTPGVAGCARNELNRYLAMLATVPLDAADLVVQTAQSVRTPLVDILLERISGLSVDAVPADADILMIGDAAHTPWVQRHLSVPLINHMLARVQSDFSNAYAAQRRQFYKRGWRAGQQQINPGELGCQVRHELLRLELAMQQRNRSNQGPALAMFEQVIDRPVRCGREIFGKELTEVFSVSLMFAGAPTSVVMSNVFILRQPGLTGANVVFWSLYRGLKTYADQASLETRINKDLRNPATDRWLKLLNERDRSALRQFLQLNVDGRVTVELLRVDGDFVEHLQSVEQQRQYSELHQVLEFAARNRIQASGFRVLCSDNERDDKSLITLDELLIEIENALYLEIMPDWVKSASDQDLRLLGVLTRRCYLIEQISPDYLSDIPSLQEYARNALKARLDIDFPGQSLDPDLLEVTLRRYIAAPSGVGAVPQMLPAGAITYHDTLTDYAINHFANLQDASLSIAFKDVSATGTLPGTSYLHELVRTQDVSGGFQALLETKLSPSDTDYVGRQRRFIEQLPIMMLSLAFEQKLQGELSTQGFAFIASILEMPDELARFRIEDRRVRLMPFSLLTDSGRHADTVPGLYLIGPQEPDKGPCILHAVFNPAFNFKEYPSQNALLEDLKTSTDLQALVLDRLSAEARKRYDHGGFVEPHVPFSTESLSDMPLRPPEAVLLSSEPVSGNALQFLFLDTLTMLKLIARQSSVTTSQADKNSAAYLLALGAEQALSLLPGKLGALVALWQSQTLLHAFVMSVSTNRWGRALSEFSAALAVLISTKDPLSDPASISEEQEVVTEPVATQETSFSWRGPQLTEQTLSKLRALEVHDFSLNQLSKDELLNVYVDVQTQKMYAAVAGKVFQVRAVDDRWRIIGEEDVAGPFIIIDKNQHWQLDLEMGLKGGGASLRTMKSLAHDLDVDEFFIVEAAGMQEIRLFYRERAREIGEARLRAKFYLGNCLDNLKIERQHTNLDPRTVKILCDFFGVETLSTRLLVRVDHVISNLFSAVMDASLSPFNSPRFVIGSNRPGIEGSTAFVFKTDPQRRIYLTERFFDPLPYGVHPGLANDQGFSMDEHHRAITLVHELSHLSLDSHDISYLESSVPYLDLILTKNQEQRALKAELMMIREYGLSHLTDRNKLFMKREDYEWRELQDSDGEEKAAVLRITGAPTLDEARTIFLSDSDKRREVMLANADSLSMLVALLGRHNFR